MKTFIAACRKQPTKHTPIWLMRQAGRYQPSYRAARANRSFLELCRDSEAAAQVTVRPIDESGMDAAILFADILLVLGPLGIGFDLDDGGPKIRTPIRTALDVERVAKTIDAEKSLGYVMETVRRSKALLGSRDVALIGFAGAPFTLASYAIEGGGSKSFAETKRFMFEERGAWNDLMSRLTSAVIDYLNAQIRAGAEAVQVFDSWIGQLSVDQYRAFVRPHMVRLFQSLDESVPRIHFGTGNPELYAEMASVGGDVIGVDWRIDLARAWAAIGDRGIMGNLDPTLLLARHSGALLDGATRILEAAGGRPGHIFNLGHGVLPQTEPESVRALVEIVHRRSAR